MKNKPVLQGWAVRLAIPGGCYYFAWSKDYPKGWAARLGKKAPPLVFATETEAEIALEAYLQMTTDPWSCSVVQVKASATHQLTNSGFSVIPIENAFALFTAS